jgi:hypothetical protein
MATKSQTQQILDHLLSGRSITRISADHLYRVAALPRRIADLKAQGHNITASRKIDATGRFYVEYALVTRNRFGQKVA